MEEAEGLAEAIGIDGRRSARRFACGRCGRRRCSARARSRRSPELAKDKDAGLLIVDAALTPIQQKNLEDEAGTKVIDRTGLILEIFGERAATAEGRLQVELAHLDYQAGSAGAELDPPRAPARRLRLPRRSRRNPDRGRPAPDPRSNGQDSPRARPGEAHARASSRPAPARAVAGDRAGRLYQRGKIDAFQPPDRRSGVRGEPAVRDARPDHAGHPPAGIRQGDPVRHGRVRVRPADRADRRVPRDAGGGRVGRSARPRPQHGASRPRGAARGRRRCARPRWAWQRRGRRRGSRLGTRSTCSRPRNASV